jgi:hypothetical protein
MADRKKGSNSFSDDMFRFFSEWNKTGNMGSALINTILVPYIKKPKSTSPYNRTDNVTQMPKGPGTNFRIGTVSPIDFAPPGANAALVNLAARGALQRQPAASPTQQLGGQMWDDYLGTKWENSPSDIAMRNSTLPGYQSQVAFGNVSQPVAQQPGQGAFQDPDITRVNQNFGTHTAPPPMGVMERIRAEAARNAMSGQPVMDTPPGIGSLGRLRQSNMPMQSPSQLQQMWRPDPFMNRRR